MNQKTSLSVFVLGITLAICCSLTITETGHSSLGRPVFRTKQANASEALYVPGLLIRIDQLIHDCGLDNYSVTSDKITEAGLVTDLIIEGQERLSVSLSREIILSRPNQNTSLTIEIICDARPNYDPRNVVHEFSMVEGDPRIDQYAINAADLWGNTKPETFHNSDGTTVDFGDDLGYDFAESAYIIPKAVPFGEPIDAIRCAYKNIYVKIIGDERHQRVVDIASWILNLASNQEVVNYADLHQSYRPYFANPTFDKPVLNPNEYANIDLGLVNSAGLQLQWKFDVPSFVSINESQYKYRCMNLPLSGESETQTCTITLITNNLLGDAVTFEHTVNGNPR